MKINKWSRNFVFALCALLSITILSGTANAQSGTSGVSGTITDTQGAAVAGANVTLNNPEKGFSRTTITNESGSYNFPTISPGTYRIEVEKNGFKKYVKSGVQALIDSPIEVIISLETGGVNETVNVTSDSIESIVNTTDASLGNNFVSEQILELPLEGREVNTLLTLQPGVTRDGYVAGGRSDQANVTVDGIDVNDQQNGTALSSVLRVTPDSVEEFRVTTTNADASKGRSSGAQVSLSIKSGTNSFRGALYEYHRNTATTANDYFNNAAGRFTANDPAVLAGNAVVGTARIPRPKLLRNLYGGRLGGPIIKDKLFFFYNYEGLRESRETSVVSTVPLASLGQGTVKFKDANGVLRSLTATQINALTLNGAAVVDVNPVGLALLANAARRYPANDFKTAGDGLNTAGYRFNAKIPQAQNTHTARIDYRLKSDDSQSLTFRGIFQNDFSDSAAPFPDVVASRRKSKPFGVFAGYNWIISNNLINSFRYGFTRQSFKDTGDSTQDSITFRGVYAPFNYSRPFSRKTDTTNLTDDLTWTKGNHNFQFGTNIRLVRNTRTSENTLYNGAIVNRSFFSGSGNVLTNPILQAGYSISDEQILSTRDAVAAVLGRFSQYSTRTNFGLDGKPLPARQAIVRKLATEEYDFYGQDTWKVRSSLTLSLGLRYGLSRPVYEQQGYQAKPNVTLEDYLQRRIQASQTGQNFTEQIQIVKAGPKNNAAGYYKWDKNNFQPRLALAWSPNFRSGFLKTLLGSDSASVFRGGFAITNDYFGQALAVNFDTNNTLGFGTNTQIAANTFNVTSRPGPLFTGLGQNIGSLPIVTSGGTIIPIPTTLTFPQNQPLDDQRRIEGSLDSNLVSPINYSWNATYGRKLPAGLYIEASYIGRKAKNLLASRDIATPNNIKDPRSGQTWYEAANILENYRRNRTPLSQIPNQPFFENVYGPGTLDPIFFGIGLSNTQAVYGFMATNDTPGCALSDPTQGCYESGTDWTYLQDVLDANTGKRLFYQRQYGALAAYGTIAGSIYHGGSLSIRQRYKGISWDLNYTFSKSIDDASGLQTSGVYGSALILNALKAKDNRAVSDFDIRHILNFNGIYSLPFGKNKMFLSNLPAPLETFLGGWQLSSIFRFNTGAPIDQFVDIVGWPTNWNVRSRVVRIKNIKSSPTKNVNGSPNLFADPTAAYRSFRSPAPGETGDRNALREPNYYALDLGLAKSFNMPWNENHKLKFRFDVFNVANTQQFDGQSIADTTFGLDPQRNGTPSSTFGNFTAIQGSPRVVQFALRYEF